MEMKVVELKAELDARGLDKSGVKAVLIDRLTNALKDEGEETDLMSEKLQGSEVTEEMTSLESELSELGKTPPVEIDKPDESSCQTICEDSQTESNKVSVPDVHESTIQLEPNTEPVIPHKLEVEAEKTGVIMEVEAEPKPAAIIKPMVENVKTEEAKPKVISEVKPEVESKQEVTKKAKSKEEETTQEIEREETVEEMLEEEFQNTDADTSMEVENIEEESQGDESFVESANESMVEAKINIISAQEILSDEEDHDALSLTVLEEERMEFDVQSANAGDQAENELKKDEEKDSNEGQATDKETSKLKDLEKTSEKSESKSAKGENPSDTNEKNDKKRENSGSQSKNGSSKTSNSSRSTSNDLPVRPRILVTGLSKATRAAQLKEIFNQYAKVATVKVLENNEGNKLSRFAHLTLYSDPDVKKCIEMLQNFELHGSIIKLQKLDASASEENIKSGSKRSSEERRLESRKSDGERRRSSPFRHHHQDGKTHRSHSSHSQPTLTFEQIKTLRDRGLEKEEADRERRRNQDKANLIASIRFEERGKIKKEYAVLQSEWDRLRSEKDEVRKRQAIHEEKLRCDRTLFERDKIKFHKEEAKLDLESRALASKWKGLDDKKRDLEMEWKMIQGERRKLEADWEKLDIEKKKVDLTRREIDEDRRKLVIAKLEFEKNMKRLDELNAEIKGRMAKRPLSPTSSPDAKRRAEARVEHRLQTSIPPPRAPVARPPVIREDEFVRRPPAPPIYRETERSPHREQPRKASYMDKELPPRGERRDFWPGVTDSIPRNSEPNRNPRQENRYPATSALPGRSNPAGDGDAWTRRVTTAVGGETSKYRDQPQVNYEREFRPQTMGRYAGDSGVAPPPVPNSNRWGTASGGEAIMGGRHPEGLPLATQQRFSAFPRNVDQGKPGGRW